MYVHRLDLGLYSHSKELLENGVRTHISTGALFYSLVRGQGITQSSSCHILFASHVL